MKGHDTWSIAGVALSSRFLLGTAGYSSPDLLKRSIISSETEVVTVGLRRLLARGIDNGFMKMIHETAKEQSVHLLPNTAGCRRASEAIDLAKMARELYGTNWVKLEIIGDDYTLQPDTHELCLAAEVLVKEDFVVLPYCTEDLVVCRRLIDIGCELLMPWGAPIGSGQGLLNLFALETLRKRLEDVTLIIDAGIGSPSDAAKAMELGFDAVLLNSAVSQANDAEKMAKAFNYGIQAGRYAYHSGIMEKQEFAVPTTPVTGDPIIINNEPN